MKNKILLAILAIALVFGMTACKDSGGDDSTTGAGPGTFVPQTAVYVGTDNDGNRYTLEITEKNSARYTAKGGDSFKLTVELLEDGNYNVALVYSGIISSTTENETGITIAVNVNGNSLNITIENVEITSIEGDIVDESGSNVVTSPGSLDTIFVSIQAFKEWLSSRPANTAATPYNVKVNIADLGGDHNTSGSLGNALNSAKYVNLDLSGSTFTSIGDGAFAGCTKLTSVTIPNTVTSIGDDAFNYCTGLTAINVDPANSAYTSENGVLYNKAKTTLVKYPIGKTGAFTIPNTVTSIGEAAFASCSSLTSVTIGNGVISIGQNAFDGCTSLTGVTIPNSVTSIGFAAFANCTSLTSVTILAGVTSIGESAFFHCWNLTSITIPNSVTSIGNSVFMSCGLTSVTIPSSVTTIGYSAFFGCTRLTNVTFETGSNITDGNFGDSAFPQGSGGSGGNTLKTAYLAASPKAGTYTRAANGDTWTKSS
jgi:hypothetical protein